MPSTSSIFTSDLAFTNQECCKCGARDGDAGVKLKRCGGCKCITFCGVECQRVTWKAHKATCKAIAEFSALVNAKLSFISEGEENDGEEKKPCSNCGSIHLASDVKEWVRNGDLASTAKLRLLKLCMIGY